MIRLKQDNYKALDFLIIYPLIILISLIATFFFTGFQLVFFDSSNSIFENLFTQAEAILFFLFAFLFFQKEVFQINFSKRVHKLLLWAFSWKLLIILNPPLMFVFFHDSVKKWFKV